MLSENPFLFGRSVPAERFVGRALEIETVGESSRVGIAHGIIYHLRCKLITNCLLIYVVIYSIDLCPSDCCSAISINGFTPPSSTIRKYSDTSSNHPNISNKRLDMSSNHPNISNKRLDMSSNHPNISNKRLDKSSNHPNISNKRLDMSSNHPNISNERWRIF